VDFGPEAVLDYNALRLHWFDQTLKGIDTGVLAEPPIRLFVMGGGNGKRNKQGRLNHGGQWRHEHEWPLARAVYTKYYLASENLLTSKPPEEKDASASYTYDPNDPVPTIGGNLSAIYTLLPPPQGYQELAQLSDYDKYWNFRKSIVRSGGFNQVETPEIYGAKPPYLPLSARHDVLVFQTPPLEQEIEITGPLRVDLWASSSAVDTDFTAKLIDVYPPNEDYPNGYALNLSDSIIRARYRDSFETQKLMEPGEIYKFTIRPYAICNVFKKGHRIRLDLSSSNWPRFDINPNTGEPLGLSNRTEKARNTLYFNEAHPSHIILPIIPR
jgi:predicted acyl esterase